MRLWLTAFVLVGSAAIAGQGAARTVWDGVYSEEQALRGERLYVARCSGCHGATLLGGEAPALVGPLFAANWEGAPLVDLFDRTRTTMPQDGPGTLSRQQTADLLAYMLMAGKFPVSGTPLGTDSGALAQITFVSIRPQPKEDSR